MRARITFVTDRPSPDRPKTPNLGLPCNLTALGEDGRTYFIPEAAEYLGRFGNRRSPLSNKGFQDVAVTGLEINIEYEEFLGDRIIIGVAPADRGGSASD